MGVTRADAEWPPPGRPRVSSRPRARGV